MKRSAALIRFASRAAPAEGGRSDAPARGRRRSFFRPRATTWLRAARALPLLAIVAAIAFAVAAAAPLRSQEPKGPDLRDLMSPAQFRAYGLSKLTSTQLAGFDAWLSRFIANLLAENRNTTAISAKDFPAFEGAVVIAQDGQHLGKIAFSQFDSDSLVNELGPYGSFVSSTSIFNPKCPYGGTLSRLSPFNPHTSIPPRIFSNGKFVGYLSVNEMKAPRIDPYALVGWLRIHQ